MKVDLSGKVALVTGAAQGIGQSIATLYSENGATVVFADIDLETAKRSAAAVKNGHAIRMDVSSETEVEQAMGKVIADFGHLDIVVNNAGINTLRDRVSIDQFPITEWDRIMKVDLTGLFMVSRLAARQMIQQKSGKIINVASVTGLVPLRLQSAYVAAKAGVVNLTKSMALELGPHGIHVNGIAPGSTVTAATRELFYGEDGEFKAQAAQLIAHIPLGRPGVPEEIAHAALFLAAPESSYITGHILTVDGGWLAGYNREF